MLFTLLNIKQKELLNEPYYSPAWNSPLILFFCQCSIYYHHKQKKADLNNKSFNNVDKTKYYNNSVYNTENNKSNVNNATFTPIDLTLDEDRVIIIDEESPRARVGNPLNNISCNITTYNADNDNEEREEKFPFEELFCYLMFLLDSLWDNMEAQYMVRSLNWS